MRIKRKILGQSIFEVVLAVGVVSVVLIGVVSLVSLVQRNTTAARNRSEATKLLIEAQEWLRRERDTDWSNFYSRSGTSTWCLNSLGWSNSGACGGNEYVPNKPFLREVRFSRTVPNVEVSADMVIRWTDSQGNHEITSSNIFTNWKTR